MKTISSQTSIYKLIYLLFFICFLIVLPLFDLSSYMFGVALSKYVLLLAIFAFAFIILNESYIDYKIILLFFIIIKAYILILSFVDKEYFYLNMFNGDSERLHIPTVKNLEYKNLISYLFDFKSYHIITGRLTHLIYFTFWSLISAFEYDSDFEAIMRMSFIINTFINILSAFVVYKTIIETTNNKRIASLGVLIIFFSPFIFTWSSMPMKEALLVLITCLTVRSVVTGNFILFVFTCILFFIERIYFLYFPFIIFLLSMKPFKIKLSLITFGILFILLLFPVQEMATQLFFLTSYAENDAKNGASIGGTSFISNLMRVIFSPQPLAAFKSNGNVNSFFYLLHFLIQPVYVYMIYKIIRHKSKYRKLIIIILLINLVLFPASARQKITLIIPLLSIIYPIHLYLNRYNEKTIIWRI